jgi:hypothetical protein
LPQNQSKKTDPYACPGLERIKRDFTMHSNQIIQPNLNLQPPDSHDYHKMTTPFFYQQSLLHKFSQNENFLLNYLISLRDFDSISNFYYGCKENLNQKISIFPNKRQR